MKIVSLAIIVRLCLVTASVNKHQPLFEQPSQVWSGGRPKAEKEKIIILTGDEMTQFGQREAEAALKITEERKEAPR